MVVVADTSPLTALLHLRQMQLLPQLYGIVYLPEAVAAELNILITFGYDISFLQNTAVFVIKPVTDQSRVQQISQQLDKGEAEAIVLAIEIGAGLLLIDEKLGKNVAQAAGIRCLGVVGLLIEAKSKGLISQIKPLLDDLVQNLNFRLSEKIYLLALNKAGESK